eukprot:COSAG02_NODE_35989_length_460_cov_1.135734_1_plen_73_part_01
MMNGALKWLARQSLVRSQTSKFGCSDPRLRRSQTHGFQALDSGSISVREIAWSTFACDMLSSRACILLSSVLL